MAKQRPVSTVRLRRLAAELLRLRTAAGLTQEEVSEQTGIHRTTLTLIERAQRRPQRSNLMRLLDLYEVPEPLRSELLTLRKDASQADAWMRRFKGELPAELGQYLEFEAEARVLRSIEPLYIPGLFQTEDYARAAIRGVIPQATHEEVEDRVAVRMARQERLRTDGLQLWTIVDEAALRRTVGSPEVMKAQLDRLREVAQLPHVTLQAMPFRAGAHPGMMGAFMLMGFPAPFPPVVYIENAAANLFLEDPEEVRRYSQMYDYLQVQALNPDETEQLIRGIAEEF